MTIRDAMTAPAVRIHPKETVWVAARMLERENIGALPVCGSDGRLCGSDGRLCGVVTDRDIVTRCLAAGRSPSTTAVEEIMTTAVVSARPDMDLELAAGLMGRRQIRRLPVTENGRLCGMLSLGDLAVKPECSLDAGDALTEISEGLSRRR